jgi:hypothetical protein
MLQRIRVASAVALAVLASSATASLGGLNKQDADRFNLKLTRIVEFGNVQTARRTAAAAKTGQVTEITDDELNAYFRYHAKDQIPVGVVEPTINALGNGRVGGRAVVDLDAVRQQKQRGWLDPLGYLTGRLPLTATGTLSTQNGIGRFSLESAELAGVTIPKTLLQELLTYYSRSAENPAGINMDDPFELPARIREIRVGKAQATVVQ